MKSRLHVEFKGLIQGVGFRPQLFVMAQKRQLYGWIQNTGDGVTAELEGPQDQLQIWLNEVQTKIKSPAQIQSIQVTWLSSEENTFSHLEIRESFSKVQRSTTLPPDFKICETCNSEIFDPTNRRYLYPFTTCAQCGPRYSLVEGLPFDRANTSMNLFDMCEECLTEYKAPESLRFHSQTNCCSHCGPQLELWDREGNLLLKDQRDNLIWKKVKDLLFAGNILALKGLGGFQFIARALDENAVNKLRKRKRRKSKPFVLMFPSLNSVREYCQISIEEEKWLNSLESPIVLLNQRQDAMAKKMNASVAPLQNRLGVLLPYTGTHALLMKELQEPLIVTSGNLSDEPICTDETEAVTRLKNIADYFLVHNRPIRRPVDDSIVQNILNQPQILRRARGYAPTPISIEPFMTSYDDPLNESIIAVGGYLKNTVALKIQSQVFISQHIGDLENEKSYESFLNTINDFQKTYNPEIKKIAYDLHPDYLSTQWANLNKNLKINTIGVQHHYAHALSCMAENSLSPPALALVWDGTGLGSDGTLWGGEFLKITRNGFQRLGNLRPFPLPGGDRASKEPLRALAGILSELQRNSKLALEATSVFPLEIQCSFFKQIEKNINSPRTSSMGRLFDALGALLGFVEPQSYEGEIAQRLQSMAENYINSTSPFNSDAQTLAYFLPLIQTENNILLDWGPMIESIQKEKEDLALVSFKFHNALAEGALSVAQHCGEKNVVLSGGVFQNRLLTELIIQKLRQNHFEVFWHHQVPPNDGGIALGQILAAQVK